MSGNVQAIQSPSHWEPPSSCLDRASRIVELTYQLAIRALFISANILMASCAFPIHLHRIVIPIVAAGASLLAGFFFSPSDQAQELILSPLPPLIRAIKDGSNDLPLDAPRGYVNAGQNCAINSLSHVLNSESPIAHFLRHPVEQNIELSAFNQFLNRYLALPSFVAAWDAYVEAQPQPCPSVPGMFSQFLEEHVSSGESRIFFINFKEKMKNLQVLQSAFSAFFRANDEALEARQSVSAGDSQTLRTAMNLVSEMIDPNSNVQLDAAEPMRLVLDVLPDDLKLKIETAYDYDTEGLPQMLEIPSPKVETAGFLTLAIESESVQVPLTVQSLFNRYCNSEGIEPHRRWSEAESECDYPVKSARVAFLEAPPALRFQIKRFRQERVEPSWYSRLFGVVAWRGVKLTTPVRAEEELQVVLKDGQTRIYRLASFIHHRGSYDGGHYIAGRIINGSTYLISDKQVTLVDQEQWIAHLNQAYYLCYLPALGQQG